MFMMLTALIAIPSVPQDQPVSAAPQEQAVCIIGSRERYERLEAMRIEIGELRVKIEDYQAKREALEQEIKTAEYKQRTVRQFNRLGVDGMERGSENRDPIHAMRNQDNLYRKRINETIERRSALLAEYEAVRSEGAASPSQNNAATADTPAPLPEEQSEC